MSYQFKTSIMKTITITEDEAQVFIDLLQLNGQTDEDKLLLDKLNSLVNANYPDPKTEVIQQIRKIIDDCGEVHMDNELIEDENRIIVTANSGVRIEIDSMGYDGVDCTEYTRLFTSEQETGNPSYNYEDLTLDVLNEIKHLADIIDADHYKTQKRCSN